MLYTAYPSFTSDKESCSSCLIWVRPRAQKHKKVGQKSRDTHKSTRKYHQISKIFHAKKKTSWRLFSAPSGWKLVSTHFLYDVQVDAYVYTASCGDNCACDGAFRKAPELLSLYLLVKILDLFHRGDFVVVCFKRMVDFAMKPIWNRQHMFF